MRRREQLVRDEDQRLAPWAMRSAGSAGRAQPEPEHAFRTEYQRDRDRVLHSRAFRRLQYKTQVFIHHEGDHFRNRLTHTLEVAQVARTIGRALGCNEDLIEAIVLAHDLGHTPFGHAGERVLHRLLEPQGGFEHNRQSLRIVDLLEQRSADGPGLNLTEETRAGILKHGSAFPSYPHPVPLPRVTPSPTAEAQIADLADEIAYHTHDIDDGLRAGLLQPESLDVLDLWSAARDRVGAGRGALPAERWRGVTAALIDLLATDLIEVSAGALVTAGVKSASDVREATPRLIGFSPQVRDATRALGRFLGEHLYRHPEVAERAGEGERVVEALWVVYRDEPERLPASATAGGEEPRERAVADWLAGMTDRFAIHEYARIPAAGRAG